MRNFAWAAIVVVLLAIAGCGLIGALHGLAFGAVRQAIAPSTSVPPTSPQPPTPPAAPAPARLSRFDPSAPDAANLELFKLTLDKAAQSTSSSSVDGKTLTAALTTVGFDATAMQRSADRTSANLQAPTLTVSVRLRAVCLVGQFVRSDASISTETASPIATGACLIGRQAAS